MTSKLGVVCVAACLLFTANALAAEEQYGPHNLDGGNITCRSPSGDEIKKWQTYKATQDRFFKEGSIVVSQISGWAPKSTKCEVSDIKRKTIKVTTDAGEIEVSVITEFTVFAGADCGTNPGSYVGKTASVECSVEATLVKYTNK